MTNEERELLEKMKAVMAENEALKMKNQELMKFLEESKTWKTIRESIICPKLKERYGEGDNMHTILANAIGRIIKEYLGVSRLTEINTLNYDQAKEMSLAILEAIQKFEWPKLIELQKYWKKHSDIYR